MINSFRLYISALLLLSLCSAMLSFRSDEPTGKLTINFIHTANGKKFVLADSTYSNAAGETYSVTKLRYYVSNFVLSGNVFRETDNYQLIDLSKSTSFTIPVKAGDYHRFGFLLGVDSVRNYSGAQAGVLD